MARVSSVAPEQAPESVRGFLAHDVRMFKVMAHSPELFQGFMALDRALPKASLPAAYRELAYLRASQINGCEYCLHYHRKFGRKAGLSEEQVAGIDAPDTPGLFDEQQRAVLAYAEALTRDAKADESLVRRLREFLSERELVELTMTIALANFTNRFNNALELELP